MATKEDRINTKLEVSGEAEYKRAIKDINANMKLLSSEMRVVSATFQDNEKKTEALRKRQDVLKKTLDEQIKKVKAAEEALRQMREKGLDDTSPAVKRMEVALNNAKAEMIRTKKEIDGVSKELKKSKVNWDDIGKTVGTVAKGFGTALVGIGTLAAGAATAMMGLTVSASNYADEILTTATNTHHSAEQLQEYAYAVRFIDADLDTLTKTMAKQIKSQDAARNGSKLVADAYKQLGVEVTNADGSLRDSNEVYWEVIDALHDMDNEYERDALAMRILGKSAQEVNTIIEAGGEEFNKYTKQAREMGVVLSEEAMNSLGEFNDKLQILEAQAEGLKNTASLITLPFLDTLATDGIGIMSEFSKGIQEADGDISKMGGVIGKGLGDIVNLIAEKAPELVGMGANIITALIEGIASNAPQIAETVVKSASLLSTALLGLLPVVLDGALKLGLGIAEGIGQAMPTLIPKIVEVIMALVQILVDNVPMLIDVGLQIVVGLVDGIIEAIPVLVDALPELIDSLIYAILEAIPQIIDAGIVLLTSLVEAMPEIIAGIVVVIPQIVNGIINALMENLPIIIQAGIDMLVALVQALPDIIVTIVGAIPQIIDGIVTALTENIDQIILAGVQLFVALIEALPEIIAAIVEAVPQIIEGIVAAIGSFWNTMAEAGMNLIKGLWQGISDAAEWLWEKVKEFCKQLTDKIKGFFGIKSPSSLFAGYGSYMAQGLGVGWAREIERVGQNMRVSMRSLARNMSAEMTIAPIQATLITQRQAIPVLAGAGGGEIGVGRPGSIQVTQNIYANETSYAAQQKEAARQIGHVIRSMMR